MTTTLSKLFAAVALTGFMLVAPPMSPPGAQAVSPDIVISQVYGGGGNSGAPLRNDYIELFNRGTTSVSLSGMSVQYASATGTGPFGGNPITPLTGTLAPGDRCAKRRKKSPSRAAAYGTRARVSKTPFSAPTVEIRNTIAAIESAFAPRKVCTARAPTAGASG